MGDEEEKEEEEDEEEEGTGKVKLMEWKPGGS